MRFLLDAMLGRLARYLRMAGHDAAYALDRGIEADDALRSLARAEDRRLVTRDADLAARTGGAILLTGKAIEDQLRELRDAGIDVSLGEPARCGRCNGGLERYRESTPAYAPSPDDEPVWRCVECGQCFWRGSHWADVRDRLASL